MEVPNPVRDGIYLATDTTLPCGEAVVEAMRIALWHDMPTGGGLRALDDQLRGLVASGHEIHVWSPPSAARVPSVALVEALHEVPLDTPSQRSNWTLLEAAWRGHRTDIEAYERHSERCANEMAAISPDLLLAHPGVRFRVPAVASHLPHLPSVLYLHEPHRALFEAIFDPPWTAKPPVPRKVRVGTVRDFVHELIGVEQWRILLRCELEWVAAFDEVLVNSRFSRESVLRAYGCDARVSPLGIDLERFPLLERPASSRGNVLFVGALVVEKNPDFLVRAVAAAGAAVKRFVWIANYVNPWLREETEATAAALGVPLEVRVAVSDEELVHGYADADVFVYAPRLEPFGLAPLEANATGLPVVAVAEAGVRETIVDGVNGVVAEPDPTAFGAALAALLDEPQRARALGRAAHDHVVEHWSLAASTVGFEALLRAVARTGSGPRDEAADP